MQPGTRTRSRARQRGMRARMPRSPAAARSMRARPAPPLCRRSRLVGVRGLERRLSEDGQDDREEVEDLRSWAAVAEVRTAVDAPAPAASDSAAVGPSVAVSMATALAATVATVAAMMSQPAERGTGARFSTVASRARANVQQARVGRQRAGKLVRARNHLLFAATRSRWSCWSREEVAAGALAQLEVDMGVDMPAGGDAGGGQARTVQGEVVRRSQGQRAARVRGGRRAEGRVWRTSEHLDVSELAVTLKRLQVFKLTLSAPVVKPSLGPS